MPPCVVEGEGMTLPLPRRPPAAVAESVALMVGLPLPQPLSEGVMVALR